MTTLDLAIVFVYLLLMLGIGLYFSSKNKTSDQFSTGAGQIPGWALGLSFYATFLSVITFLGDPGKSFATNWNPFVFSLSMPLAAVVAVKYFIPFYRNRADISAYTHLEQRFGPWARTYVMACFILTQLARMGTILYGIALVFHTITGIDMRLIIIVTCSCIIIYTVIGGMVAVIWTEVIQAIVKTVGALLIMGILMAHIGITEIITKGLAEHKFNLGSMKPDLYSSSFWVVLIYGFFINLTNFGIDQNYIQRYHTARNSKDAAKSIWLCVWFYVPVSFLFFFIGTALFVFYNQYPELIQSLKQQVAMEKHIAVDLLRPSDYGDKVLPFFMKTQIPTGLLGMLLAALLSAAMSTMSNGMNSSATVFLKDIYMRYIRKDSNVHQQLMVLRSGIVVMGVLGMVFGLAMIGVKSLLDVWWKLAGIFAAGMLGIFLLGIISQKVQNKHAKIATLAGILSIAWMSFQVYLPSSLQYPLETKLTIVIGTLTIVLVGLTARKLFSKDVSE